MHPASRAVLAALVVVELIITVAATCVHVMSAGRVLDTDDVPDHSTVLVLGSLVEDDEPGDYVRGRLDTAIELYRAGRADRIINSGNGITGEEPAVMRRYMEERGVDGHLIADDPGGLDTVASCRRARDEFGVRRAVIVTQDFHLSRAIALCRSVGVDATGVEAGCECPILTVVRNHVRELLLARPRALLSVVTGR
ncbi:vancomycin high temperature exclusion protein [Gordonia sp. OPL2]|uniref:SanA/YdcF family protein n=1 Tax=Gordonia sp. OPL2 TaxID=2486274 RepID=UPI0021CCB712|nr:YdcF family protein [Gordonia sp. OPL2]